MSPTVGANCQGLRQRFSIGVLTKVEIDENAKKHESFRQVQTSQRIITLRPMFWCIMVCWVRDPLYPSFYMPKG
jgi:hypothetical protein